MLHHSRITTALRIALLLLAPLAGHALTLPEGLTTVTEQGRDVAIARSDEEAAKSGLSLARSTWLPTVDLYGRETWLRDQPAVKIGPGGIPVYTSQDQFSTFGVRATQVIYDFGKTSSSVSSANYGLKAREAGTFRARNRSALEFVVAFFDLLESEELLKVAQEEVTRYEAHGRDAASRHRAGVVTRNEVLQAEVLLADSKQRLLTAENTRTLRASKINSTLMRRLNDPVKPEAFTGAPLGDIPLEQAWAEAGQSNPDLKDLDARVRAKDENVSAIRSDYLPTIFVAGGYEYQENKYQLHPETWMVMAGVNVNLFAGGATSAKVGAAKAEALTLKLTREKLLDAVRLDVQSAWLDLQSSTQKVQVAQAAVAQAAENLRLQRLRYKEGVGTSTEVLDAVTLMTTSETNAAKANFAVRRAEAALQYSMGRDLAAAYGAEKISH